METLPLTFALPPSPAALPTPSVELNDRDLAVIYKIAVFKYLSSTQIRRLFWPHAEHQTAAKRLNQLVQAGLLRRRFIDNRATDEAHNSRLAVFDWPGPCQTKLKQSFIARRAEHRWQAYAAVIKSHAHDKTVSSGHLRHEVAVSEFFLYLEEAVERDGWQLWWRRTSSPTTKGVSCWVKLDPGDPDSDEVHFSPDSIWGLANPQQQYLFGTFELESRDKKKSKQAYRRRLQGHQAVAEQNIFAGILAEFIAAHQIPLRTDPADIGMHSLTVASDQGLRDDLFVACATVASPAT
jgi:Replication-relaxation